MKIIKLEEVEKLSEMEINEYFQTPVVIPTETVYGLAARIDNEDALKGIYKIKGRPSDNPLIVHIGSIEMLMDWIEGDIPLEHQILIDKFWPGPLSLLFKPKKHISKIVLGNNMENVVIRMPKSEKLRNLINRLNVPLAAPSANKSGSPSPTRIEHVISDLADDVNLFIDGGECTEGLESTIFGIINNDKMLLRPGSITVEQLNESLNDEIRLNFKANKKVEIICPGQKYKHYSPRNPLYLFVGMNWEVNMAIMKTKHKNKRIGLLNQSDMNLNKDEYIIYELGECVRDCAKNLFDGIITLDSQCDIIFVRQFAEKDVGMAIMDRLKKAASEIIE